MDTQTTDVSITKPVWDRIQMMAKTINGSPHNLANSLLRQKLDEMGVPGGEKDRRGITRGGMAENWICRIGGDDDGNKIFDLLNDANRKRAR